MLDNLLLFTVHWTFRPGKYRHQEPENIGLDTSRAAVREFSFVLPAFVYS